MKSFCGIIAMAALVLWLSCAVAGAQSTVTVTLVPGWNLISLPVQPANTNIASVLSGIAGAYEAVWAYSNGVWQVYDPNDPAGSTLTAMQAGNGYWIKMTAQKTLSVSGSAPPAALALQAGWNLVGYAGGTSCAPASTALSLFTGALQVAWGYPSPSKGWQFYDPANSNGSTFQFCPGLGYWFDVNGPASWILSPSELPLTVTTRYLPAAAAGSAYTETLGVVGAGPFEWSGSTIAQSASGNNGIAVGETTGILSGTPSFTGTQPLFLTAQGASGSVGIEYDLSIGGAGSTQNILGAPPSGVQGSLYNYTFVETWDVGQISPCGDMTWVFGSIPPGMEFNPLEHTLTGTPTFAGAYTFTIYSDPVTSACGPSPTNFKTVTVSFAPSASSGTPAGSSDWTRQGSAAVLSPGASGWDGFMIGAPSVIKVGGVFSLYYEGESSATFLRSIGLATSSDGSAWTKFASNPVLAPGAAGEWDAGGVRYPVVYFDGTKYWMWYQGTGANGPAIGLATSHDGVAWTKSPSNPVFTLSGLISSYVPGAVVKPGAQFMLFYSADGNIGQMTSTDGVNWTDAGAVFSTTDSDSLNFSRPAVIWDGSTYRMWYTRIEALGGGAGNPNGVYPITIGYGDSLDGTTWNTYGNPIFTAGSAGAWDRPGVGVPAVIKDGSVYRMWYVGGRGNLPGALFQANPFVEGAIGYAIIP